MTTIEQSKELNPMEELVQETTELTNELKESIEQENKPWIVTYLNESDDGNYNIFKYRVEAWENKLWIKNKYVNQIWPWIDWTQFTDTNLREIKKDRFNDWEVVYLKVPKQKSWENQIETGNIPGKVQFVRDSKDKENKDRKVYKYTFAKWGNLEWVMNKVNEQINRTSRHPIKFCDENLKELSKKNFNKWETVYIKVPNLDVVNNLPEMNIDEIMNLSDNDIIQIMNDLSDCEEKNINEFYDKKWTFRIIYGKKFYLEDRSNGIKSNTTYLYFEAHESIHNIYNIALARKVGNTIRWVFYDWYSPIYRWNLKEKDHLLYPKDY